MEHILNIGLEQRQWLLLRQMVDSKRTKNMKSGLTNALTLLFRTPPGEYPRARKYPKTKYMSLRIEESLHLKLRQLESAGHILSKQDGIDRALRLLFQTN